MKKIIYLFFIFGIFSSFFYYRDDSLKLQINYLKNNIFYQPCKKPILYSIGEIDKRFEIERGVFLKAIQEAEDSWETASNRNLFDFNSESDLIINLTYDSRQENTQVLNNLSNTLDLEQNDYNSLEKIYEKKVSEINIRQNSFDAKVLLYNDEISNYEKEVQKWNTLGGAPRNDYRRLNNKRLDLNNTLEDIKEREQSLNKIISQTNQLAINLNRIADNLDMNVEEYNGISTSLSEFEQGVYHVDFEKREINIFQFSNYDKLVRVLIHEMGHALGLNHLENQKSIMYYKNIGLNKTPNDDDIAALNIVCQKDFSLTDLFSLK